MKKQIIWVVLGIFLLLTGCSGPAETPADASPTPTTHDITGKVIDAAMHTLTLETAEGTYLFSLQGATVDAGEQGLLIGDSVQVTYIGDLVPGEDVQPVHVQSVKVETSITMTTSPASQQNDTSSDVQAYAQAAQDVLSGMTLAEKVGQMFMARCPAEGGAALAEQWQLGGYLLFADQFEDKTPNQVKLNIEDYQAASKIPLLIGVDEEGGTVNRVSRYQAFRDTPFLSPQDLYQNGGFDRIAADTKEKARLLDALGINLNFAPVCDVSTNPSDFINARAFGQDANMTAKYVQTVVTVNNEAGMGSVLKHFPGYGNNADTHTGVVRDERPMSQFTHSDLLPFRAGMEAGAQFVLVAHNIVTCMDAEYPASLSAAVHKLLREDVGFSGIILTDDLVMDGIREFTGNEEAAVLAVQAGNDMLTCTDFEVQIPAVISAVERGDISESRIDESVLRILQYKFAAGILTQ